MLIKSKDAEFAAVLDAANAMCAAASLGLLGEYKMIIGIPLSVSGKTPFFDREPV